MADATETVEEIVEREISGTLAYALQIHEAQIAAANFVEQFCDFDRQPVEPDWRAVDYAGIPRELFELLQRVADYDARLPSEEGSA